MTEKSLRRVRPGQPLDIPAGTWNRILDATEKTEGRGAVHSRGRKGHGLAAGVAIVYNRSSQTCPAYGVVEVASESPGATAAQVEILRPGESGGSGTLYGIALEPIPSGRFGRAAFAGGPWPVLCSAEPNAGETLGAIEGSWQAGEGTSFVVARRPVGGLSLAFFSRGRPSEIKRADAWRLIEEAGSATRIVQERILSGDSFVVSTDALVAWKFEEPLSMPAPGETGTGVRWGLEAPPYGSGCRFTVDMGVDGLQDDAVGQVRANFVLKAITQDFDLATVDRAGVESLPGVTTVDPGDGLGRPELKTSVPQGDRYIASTAEMPWVGFDGGSHYPEGAKFYGGAAYVGGMAQLTYPFPSQENWTDPKITAEVQQADGGNDYGDFWIQIIR